MASKSTCSPRSTRVTAVYLKPDENSFTVRYIVTDSIDEDHYDYYYQISSEVSKQWINNGAQSTISLAKLHPGDYAFSVKAVDRFTGNKSLPASFMLHLAAPWYATWWMKVIWWITGLAAGTDRSP